MASKPCPRCKRLIPAGMGYCTECKPAAEAAAEQARERRAEYKRKRYNTAYNKRRDPKYKQFYQSKAWKATSKSKLQAACYHCEAKLDGCTRLAVEVHHIKPIQTPEGWDARLDWDNLEAVCTACHNRRHPDKLRVRKGQADVIDMREVLRDI